MAKKQRKDGPDRLAVTRMVQRYQTVRFGLGALTVIIGITALWVPLQVVGGMVRDVAGRDTSLDMAVKVTVAVSVGFTVACSMAGLKIWRQRQELRRLRRRVTELEAKLEETKPNETAPEKKQERKKQET